MLQHLTALAESTGDDLLSLIGQSFDITAQLESLSLPRILLALLTATLCGAIIYLVYRMFYRGSTATISTYLYCSSRWLRRLS